MLSQELQVGAALGEFVVAGIVDPLGVLDLRREAVSFEDLPGRIGRMAFIGRLDLDPVHFDPPVFTMDFVPIAGAASGRGGAHPGDRTKDQAFRLAVGLDENADDGAGLELRMAGDGGFLFADIIFEAQSEAGGLAQLMLDTRLDSRCIAASSSASRTVGQP